MPAMSYIWAFINKEKQSDTMRALWVLCLIAVLFPWNSYGQITPVTPEEPDIMYIIGDMLVQEVKVRKYTAASAFADKDSTVVLRGYSQESGPNWIERYWDPIEDGRHGFGRWQPDSLGYWLPDSIWTEPWVGPRGIVGLPRNGCAWPSSPSPGGGFWYGDLCYVPIQIFEVLHGEDDARNYIYIKFQGSYSDGLPFHIKGSGMRHWEHFVNHGALHIGSDTLFVRDGITSYQRRDKGVWPLPDFCGYNEEKSVCWHDTGIAFEHDDILRVGISSKPAPPGPAADMVGELRIWRDRTDSGSSVPGSVWLSWRIPGGENSFHAGDDHAPILAEQMKWEKRWGIHYEYRVLRDGDREWKTLLLDATDLHEPEVVQGIPSAGWVYQRRKHRITGLDPMGEYSFCVRAANAFGPGKEICNLGIITPVSVDSGELPVQVSLFQNHPNPFNPSTTIAYTLEHPGPVELSVYDLTGRIVSFLVDGVQPAGYHEVRFNADGLPTGTYIYRLSVGAETLTRTMTLVR